jgi:hypothetical protein
MTKSKYQKSKMPPLPKPQFKEKYASDVDQILTKTSMRRVANEFAKAGSQLAYWAETGFIENQVQLDKMLSEVKSLIDVHTNAVGRHGDRITKDLKNLQYFLTHGVIFSSIKDTVNLIGDDAIRAAKEEGWR